MAQGRQFRGGTDAGVSGYRPGGAGLVLWRRRGTLRTHALRQAIYACRKGGTVSIPGVYGGLVDKFPLGIAFSKGLTFKMGQTNVQKYLRPLLKLIQDGMIDPSFVITHRLGLTDAPNGYDTFRNNQDDCIKVVMTTNGGNSVH